MNDFINRWFVDNWNLVKGAFRVSFAGASNRLGMGLLELIPQLLFYLANSVILFAMFSVIGGEAISKRDLTVFLFVMFSVDSLGDALIFKGIQEYTRSLRRGQSLYYQLSPGTPLFKVLFFRWDLPMLGLGVLSGLTAAVLSFFWYGTFPLLVLLYIGIGTLMHGILTGAYHIIQAYFDPTMPIPFGNPASRLYTKPMHLFVSGGVTLGVMTTIYPAYFITAYPAGLATGKVVGVLSGQPPLLVYSIGLLGLAGWAMLCNRLIKISARAR